MKFYSNNSYTLINIKKESVYHAMESCKYYLNGRCLLLGTRCSQQKNCKSFEYINSTQHTKGKYNKNTPQILKIKTVCDGKGIDYSKPYSITVYKIHSYTGCKSEYFYISNKDYNIEKYQRIDVGSELASKIRKTGLYQNFIYNNQQYRLEKLFKHQITK